MKKRIAAAILGAFFAVPFFTACSDHNIIDDSASETVTEAVYSAKTETTTENAVLKPSNDNFGQPSATSELNRPQYLYITDNGEYVYLSGKEGLGDAYILDDRNGHTRQLPFPSKSLMLHVDGSSLYYYSPDEGICEYKDGKSKSLNAETAKKNDSDSIREEFYFTDDAIYFASPTDSGTVIKSIDYSGKLSDKKYELEYKNARIVGIAEIDGKKSLLCSYRISINENIRIFDEKGNYKDIKSGNSPYIVGDNLYYIKNQCLWRNTLSGDDEKAVTDKGCISYCFYKDKLYCAVTAGIYVVDKDGNTKEILNASDLENTDFIDGICTADDRLFVSGGSGAFLHSLAEIDENGNIKDMIHSDK
ncbi:hypothetical protein [Ruminococcus sp.]|uniref:hypothetical protein n=1 Tax=Ruminococcus sp. TaxID=41978 RepID=UPI0025D1AEEB|nr:hypothetical protein [Ruminococcus sp.]